ncbi:HipA domain-containing protein [Peredibacter sp. HCB2-198]|uniref:HipA domain-containing protein n=1 Tax=Peredibacter sp. HCB2-198 TaxID=3383025 RepID=UPI0038B46D20
MKKEKCLGCYQDLEKKLPGNYHTACSKKLFGTEIPPEVDFGSNDLEELAIRSLTKHLGIAGVQPKISTQLEKKENDPTHRLMIVDWEGHFILKPPTKEFPQISVVEDLTMHMAERCGLTVARHGLIKLKTGELAYVTKRFDRQKKGKKIAVEDFCQLSELLTENKYNSSIEKAGKIILKHATNSGLDVVNFFDLILFSYLTGNSDMHLKNFSLMRNDLNEIGLTPFYDLLATKLLLPEDKEEVALTINGKKNKLKKDDFITLGKGFKIGDKAIEKSFERILRSIPEMKDLIERSFISKKFQEGYSDLIDLRAKVLAS